jgi:hypothetical protein
MPIRAFALRTGCLFIIPPLDVVTGLGVTAPLPDHVFTTIIVKTFHTALDVMFATASYKIGRKGFVACSRKNSDKFWFQSFIGALCWREKRLHVSVFQRESADKYAAQGGTTGSTWSGGGRLASPPTRTLPEPYSVCDSERIKMLSLNRMDDLSSLSRVVHHALCRHWNGATVASTETIVALI